MGACHFHTVLKLKKRRDEKRTEEKKGEGATALTGSFSS